MTAEDQLEARRAYDRARYAANREAERERSRAYYAAHREERREYDRMRYERDRDQILARVKARRARQVEADRGDA